MRGTQAPAPDRSPGPPRQILGTWGHSPGFGGHGNPIRLRTAFYTQHEASTGGPFLLQRAALPRLPVGLPGQARTPVHPCLGSADPRPGAAFPSQAQRCAGLGGPSEALVDPWTLFIPLSWKWAEG